MRTTLLGGLLGRIPRPTPAMAVALLAVLIAASGAAVAAIPSGNGTITACFNKNSGALRVVNTEVAPPQTCTSKETQLTWKDGIHGTVANADNAANADKLDNKDSTEFLGKTEKASDSALFDGKDPSAFLGADQKAADSEKLDGIDSTEFAKAYKRTVVVSPVGTDTENGTALLAAISNITDASASKPYLLHIEPATYDLGNGSLNMKQWVDIEGSGELNTVITSSVSSGTCFPQHPGTLNGASNAEMRFLTVRNMGTGVCSSAIFNKNASPRLTHVTAEITGPGNTKAAVWNDSSSPTMTDVSATASGGGSNAYAVFDNGSSPTMTDVSATASGGSVANYGVFNQNSSSPTIRQSELSGTTAALDQNTGGSSKVALSQLVGRVLEGPVQCFNNYNENMAAVTCP